MWGCSATAAPGMGCGACGGAGLRGGGAWGGGGGGGGSPSAPAPPPASPATHVCRHCNATAVPRGVRMSTSKKNPQTTTDALEGDGKAVSASRASRRRQVRRPTNGTGPSSLEIAQDAHLQPIDSVAESI